MNNNDVKTMQVGSKIRELVIVRDGDLLEEFVLGLKKSE